VLHDAYLGKEVLVWKAGRYLGKQVFREVSIGMEGWKIEREVSI
jgi:hypothetical protein